MALAIKSLVPTSEAFLYWFLLAFSPFANQLLGDSVLDTQTISIPFQISEVLGIISWEPLVQDRDGALFFKLPGSSKLPYIVSNTYCISILKAFFQN